MYNLTRNKICCLVAETNWENVPATKLGLLKPEKGPEPDVYIPVARKDYLRWPKLKSEDVFGVERIARPVQLVRE